MSDIDRIIYLVNNGESNIVDFKLSLKLLNKNFLTAFPHEVVAFHEDLSEQQTREIQQETNVSINFVKVNWPSIDTWNKNFRLGYCQMCRFFSYTIYNQPIIKDSRYIWRLDTDSFIEKEIHNNLFEEMRENHRIYGYLCLSQDQPHTTVGLWGATKEFIDDNGLKPDTLKTEEDWNRHIIYTNFEIINTQLFRQELYQRFFDHLDKKYNGFYAHRWGDACIRYLYLSMTNQINNAHKFSHVSYKHQGYAQ